MLDVSNSGRWPTSARSLQASRAYYRSTGTFEREMNLIFSRLLLAGGRDTTRALASIPPTSAVDESAPFGRQNVIVRIWSPRQRNAI